MPQMDGTGSEKKGPQTGRGLGKCSNVPKEEAIERLGTGMGLHRKSGGGQGQGDLEGLLGKTTKASITC